MKKLRDFLYHRFSDIFYIWNRELKYIFADQGVIIFFIIVPLIYPILYAWIYNHETVREVPMVVVDEDRSSYSREFIRRVDATPDVFVAYNALDLQEANHFVDSRDAFGILIIPKGFAKDLMTGVQTHVELHSDLSGILYYKAYMMALNEISLRMGREVSAALNYGPSGEATKIQVRPIESHSIAVFNPQSGFESFLLPPVLVLIIQQTMLLGVCMLAGTARERNKFHYLVPVATRHYGGPMRIVLGKSLSYIFIYMINTLWTLVAVPWLFNLPMLGSAGTYTLFLIPFLLACTFFSLFISLFFKNRETTLIVLVFTSVIFLFLVGVSWPRSAIPPFWRAFGFLIPSTPGAQGMIAINTMGAKLSDIEVHYKTLWLQTGFYMILATIGYSNQLTLGKKSLRKALIEHLRNRYRKSME
ncbi:ABC transporter permease [Porphyromonas pogonae]|uniref:ABC transporter permease n=1 Tax=Porphyromonas pogonae TaxID=867595 RepID=UPI002E7A4A13|nr:ABC transporter permease [Porphyromonas pogonae]